MSEHFPYYVEVRFSDGRPPERYPANDLDAATAIAERLRQISIVISAVVVKA